MPTEMVIDRASGYGFPAVVVDGTDVIAVREATERAIWHIRNHGTPYFIEMLVSRIGPHKQILVDSRTSDRIRYARMRDPLIRFRSSLMAEEVLNQGEDSSIRKDVEREVEAAVTYARKGTPVLPSDLSKYIYAGRSG